MNATFVLLTTAWLSGAEAAPHAPPPAAPAVTAASSACDCACDDGCCKESWFSKLKRKWGRKHCDECDTCNTCNTCEKHDTCNDCYDRPSWWDRVRAKFHKHSCCDACDSCASCGHDGAAHPASPAPEKIQKMPKEEKHRGRLPAGEPNTHEPPKATTAIPTLDPAPAVTESTLIIEN